jgi:hypothetical protein
MENVVEKQKIVYRTYGTQNTEIILERLKVLLETVYIYYFNSIRCHTSTLYHYLFSVTSMKAVWKLKMDNTRHLGTSFMTSLQSYIFYTYGSCLSTFLVYG